MTVLQHMNLYATISGIPEDCRDREVKEMIQAVELAGKEGVMAGKLTHGSLRKLTLGMALIGRPKLVVLSNPLEGVDPKAKKLLVQTIMKYTEGRALLFST